MCPIQIFSLFSSESDPGFPVGGGANHPGESTYDFAKFSKKLHEIEKILGARREVPPYPLPQP